MIHMKTPFSTLALAVAVSFITTPGQSGPSESGSAARIIQTKGPVEVAGSPASAGGTAKNGQKITTGKDGYLLLGLAPGQYVFASEEATLTVKELAATATGKRESVVLLEKGYVLSAVHPPKDGTTAHTITTHNSGQLKAKGTAWSTSVTQSDLVAVSYAGAVVYNYPGIGDVVLPPGSIGTLTGVPQNPVFTVVDLVHGRVYIYRPGQPVEEQLADASDLSLAARLFERGIPAFRGTASSNEALALAQLITVINGVLAQSNVAPIAAGGSELFPLAGTSGSGTSELSGVASPESPNP